MSEGAVSSYEARAGLSDGEVRSWNGREGFYCVRSSQQLAKVCDTALLLLRTGAMMHIYEYYILITFREGTPKEWVSV